MPKRKEGDRVTIKDKYFNQFNGLSGTIKSIDEHYERFTVEIDDKDGLFEFNRYELVKEVK